MKILIGEVYIILGINVVKRKILLRMVYCNMVIDYKRKIKLVVNREMGFGYMEDNGWVRFKSVGMCLNSNDRKNSLSVLGEYEIGNPIIERLVFDCKETKADHIYCEVVEGMISSDRGKHISEYDLRGVRLPSRVDRVYFNEPSGDIKVRHCGWGYSYYKWNQDENKWIQK